MYNEMFALSSSTSYIKYMKLKCGEDLVALAATLSIKVSECMDIEELCSFIEFVGLMRHNLEIIKHRRIANKIHEKRDHKGNTEKGD
jgi:hypothetical protein